MKKKKKLSKNWLLLIYPIGLNKKKSSGGGYEHYLANKEIYKGLNYKIILIDTLCWPFISFKSDILKINCIPFFKNTSFDDIFFLDQKNFLNSNKNYYKFYNLIFLQFRNIRDFLLKIFIKIILSIFKPKVVHQRSNMRFMLKKSNSYFLITELNDNFNLVPDSDLILTVDKINIPDNYLGKSLVNPWPVINYKKILNYQKLDRKMVDIRKNNQKINILHLGDFGSKDEILRCFNWLQTIFYKFKFLKNINLITYGSYENNFNIKVNHQIYKFKALPFTNPNNLKSNNINLGLIYYSKEKYTEDRIRTGFPTKLSLYIDLSLPVIINRLNILEKTNLIDFSADIFSSNLISTNSLYDSYLKVRKITSVQNYSKILYEFFNQDNY